MLNQVYQEVERKMAKTAEALKSEFAGIRTGRANPNLLDGIKVQSYGTAVPLNQVAGISVPEARLLIIQPWDKAVLPEIEKAILKSELGLTPVNDGRVIRLPIPPLTEERRRDLTKLVKKMAEESKVAVRNIRREANDEVKKLEKEKKISEDDSKKAIEKIQEITDRAVKGIEEILAKKEKEIMEV